MSRLAASIIVIIVTVHTHAHAAVLFADDFESGLVNPSWTVVDGIGVIADPTGERPMFVASPTKPVADNLLIKVIPIVPGTTVRGFFYENGADDGDDHTWGLDGVDGSTTFRVESGSVGPPSSFDFYLFDPEGGEVFETSIARTVGWHEFRFEVTTSGTNAFIDGTPVGSSPISMYEFFVLANERPGGNPVYWDDICIFTEDGASCPPINVNIDIKPGSDPNCFNINGNGVVPVAILSSDDFDVSGIDQSTLSFAGLNVRVRGNKGPFCGSEDVNDDGLLDLVCHFVDDTTNWVPDTNDLASLGGTLLDGTPFTGTDSICVVP